MRHLFTEINERTVLQVLRQEIPGFTVSSIRFHKACADRCVAEVNDQLILKFPFCEEALESMVREQWVIGALQGHTSVAVPTPVFVAQSNLCFGYRHLDFRYFFCLDPSLQDAIVAHYSELSGQQLSTACCVLYGVATDLSDLVYCTEENMPIVDGPVSARVARLRHYLSVYKLW